MKGVSVEPLRIYGGHGIYAATMMHTTQSDGKHGCGGYFGVQWLGAKNDKLLFSIWDNKLATGEVNCRALPMHANCYRNGNDSHDENGSQCQIILPEQLKEGEELVLSVERGPVESTAYNQVTYHGHVWTIMFIQHEQVIPLGRMLFTDKDLVIGDESSGGITGMSFFHEHIGCTPCGSFAFEAQRKGPFITQTAGNTELPELQGMTGEFGCNWNTLGNCTCRALDIESEEFGSVNFLTGSEGLVPHWDVRETVKIY